MRVGNDVFRARPFEVMFLMETLPKRDVELLCDKGKLSSSAWKDLPELGFECTTNTLPEIPT